MVNILPTILTPAQRRVVAAVCRDGMEYKEASFFLGVKVRTVRRHMEDARNRAGRANTNQLCHDFGSGDVE